MSGLSVCVWMLRQWWPLLRQLVRLNALAPHHTQSRSQYRWTERCCLKVTHVIANYRRRDATSDTSTTLMQQWHPAIYAFTCPGVFSGDNVIALTSNVSSTRMDSDRRIKARTKLNSHRNTVEFELCEIYENCKRQSLKVLWGSFWGIISKNVKRLLRNVAH